MKARATGPGAGSAADLVGRHAEVQLEPGERVVEPAPGRRRPRPGTAARRTASRVEERRDGQPGVAEDLQPEGVEGPDADGVRRSIPSGRERRVEARPQLLRRATVEGDGRDRGRVDPARDEPGDPGDERRRLAASRPARRTGPGPAARWRRPAGPASSRASRSATAGGEGDHGIRVAEASHRPINWVSPAPGGFGGTGRGAPDARWCPTPPAIRER